VRAQAQASTLKSVGWQAQRVADIALGAAATGADAVAETTKPLRSQSAARRQVSRLRRRAPINLRKAERRGAVARRGVASALKRQRNQGLRQLKRNRRQAEQHVRSSQGEVARRVDQARDAAEDLTRQITPDAITRV
jgi:hypothetical protein